MLKGFLLRPLAAFFAAWLVVAPVYADSAFVAPSATGQAATGQLPGTTTNDNAAAGKVGEYVSASNADTGLAQTGSTVTITIASPAVVTWGTTTPFVFNCGTPPCSGAAVVNFTTTGALPTGLVAGTNYYAIGASVSGNTFQLASSPVNAVAGTAINTSGTQSGTHTGVPTAILGAQSVSVAALSLAAGDWDVVSDVGFFTGSLTSITALSLLTTTSATEADLTGLKPGQLFQNVTPAQVPGAANFILHVGPARYSFASTTTVFCRASAAFTASTLAAWGGCHARRAR